MFHEIDIISERINDFITSEGRIHSIVLCSDDDGFSYLYSKVLNELPPENQKSLLFMNFDFFCWSPEHFCEQFYSLLENGDTSDKSDDSYATLSIPPGPSDEIASDFLFRLFTAVNTRLTELQQKRLVFIDSFHALQTILHYKHYQSVYTDMHHVFDNCSQLLFIIRGRKAWRREKKYDAFLSEMSDYQVPLLPLDRDAVSRLSNEYGVQLSDEEISLLFAYTGGIYKLLESLLPLCKKLSHEEHSSLSDDFFSSLLEDRHSSLFSYYNNRYFLSVERAKGHGSIRTILSVLSRKQPLNLTSIATIVKKSPPAVKDYLESLIEVGLVCRHKNFYSLSDVLFSKWLIMKESHWRENRPKTIFDCQWNHVTEPSDPAQKIQLKTGKRAWKDNSFVEFD